MKFFVYFPIFFLFSLSLAVENCSLKVSELTKKGFPTQENLNFTEIYDIIELENTTEARCLDGTNFKFFYSKGSGSGANKWMVFWQAASFCGAEGIEIVESCYQKSVTVYGSSKDIGENGTKYVSNVPSGYFSNTKEFNPKFWNYNKIYIPYCDGSLHQGYLQEPILHNDTYLYFRGYQNTYSTLHHAKKYLGMNEAFEVVLTGTSSGALALFFWVPYIRENLFDKSVRMWAIFDAGLFLDTYNDEAHCFLFRYQLRMLANLTNSTNMTLFKNCSYNNEDTIWKCFLPQYNFENVTVPVFIMNDQDDYSQLTSLNSIECIADGGAHNCKADDRQKIEKIREIFLRVIFKTMIPQKPHWGFWLRTCFEHTLAGTWAWYGHNYTAFNAELYVAWNVKDSLEYWYNNGEFREMNNAYFIDFIDWEHNPECTF